MDTQNTGKSCCSIKYSSIGWWTTLVVAVLAVPSLGIVLTLMTGTHDFMALAVFMVACWACTWLGMRLMQNPKVRDTLDIDKQ